MSLVAVTKGTHGPGGRVEESGHLTPCLKFPIQVWEKVGLTRKPMPSISWGIIWPQASSGSPGLKVRCPGLLKQVSVVVVVVGRNVPESLSARS